MARKTSKQRIFMLVSLVLFGGSALAGTLRLYGTATPEPAVVAEPEADALAAQIRGYEAVLQREPNNQTALEGLVLAHLQTQNRQEAVAPLKKLIQLNPDRADLKTLLAEVKQPKTPSKTP